MRRPAILFLFCVLAGRLADADQPRIVIVGAGASGIAAAAKLFENGFEDVKILEAEDRIGGRVHTVPFDDYVVDLGGQWIHGDRENPSYDLASPLNLTDHSDPYQLKLYATNGQRLNQFIADNVTETFFQYLETRDNGLLSNCNTSFGECVEPILKEHFKQFPELNGTLQDQLLWCCQLFLTGLESADSWFDVAGESYDEESDGDRAVNWKTRGYGTILDLLMKKFPNPEEELPVLNNTILNAEVTKIDYSSDDGPIKITTQDGKEYLADHVIMTPSLGVLKADHATLFNPSLPESKIKSIEDIGFGNAAKVILAFNNSWFNPKGLKNFGFHLLWSKQERIDFEKDPKKMWIPYAASFNIVEHKPRLLLLWISGRGGQLLENLSDQEVRDQVTEMLFSFLSKDYNVTEPIAMIRTKWHENKHFRGAYSYSSLAAKEAGIGPEQLAEPITKMDKPVILFAGEATNPNNSATVHGAIAAGWREADRLINLYPNKTS